MMPVILELGWPALLEGTRVTPAAAVSQAPSPRSALASAGRHVAELAPPHLFGFGIMKLLLVLWPEVIFLFFLFQQPLMCLRRRQHLPSQVTYSEHLLCLGLCRGFFYGHNLI